MQHLQHPMEGMLMTHRHQQQMQLLKEKLLDLTQNFAFMQKVLLHLDLKSRK